MLTTDIKKDLDTFFPDLGGSEDLANILSYEELVRMLIFPSETVILSAWLDSAGNPTPLVDFLDLGYQQGTYLALYTSNFVFLTKKVIVPQLISGREVYALDFDLAIRRILYKNHAGRFYCTFPSKGETKIIQILTKTKRPEREKAAFLAQWRQEVENQKLERPPLVNQLVVSALRAQEERGSGRITVWVSTSPDRRLLFSPTNESHYDRDEPIFITTNKSVLIAFRLVTTTPFTVDPNTTHSQVESELARDQITLLYTDPFNNTEYWLSPDHLSRFVVSYTNGFVSSLVREDLHPLFLTNIVGSGLSKLKIKDDCYYLKAVVQQITGLRATAPQLLTATANLTLERQPSF
jgi:hypothetical protein